MLRKVSVYSSYIRLSHWWQYKAAPLTGLFFLMMYAGRIDLADSLLLLCASLITIVGIAGLGYFINDLGDVEYDQRVGKVNFVSRINATQRIFVAIVLLTLAFLPWLYLPNDLFSWSLIAFQFLLYISYSLKPFRFKERGITGIVCDSLYGLAVPAVLAVYTYHLASERSMNYFHFFFVLLFFVLLVKGFRNILIHQIEDRRNDKRSGINTLVLKLGSGKSVRLINQFITPFEFLLLSALVALISFTVPLFWISLVAFVVYHFLKIGAWGIIGITRRHLRFKFLYALNDYYEQWLPLYSLFLLISLDWRFCVFLVITLLVFPGIFASLYPGTKKIIENLRKLGRGDYGKWWSPRHGRFMYSKHYDSNKFVFAACGKRDQIEHLHFSLRAISHFTSNEIIVITDKSRNEIPIEWKTIIDVKTPPELNHGQARLFLKTSVHRYLPTDCRYCFLDTHVLALSEDADDIFNHKTCPVTFAPDGMRLRAFSPHAVHCGCLSDRENKNGVSLNRQRVFLKKIESEKSGRWRFFLFALRFYFSSEIFKLDDDTFYNKSEKYWFDSKGNIIYSDQENVGQCDHLRQAIQEKFKVEITDRNWHHWNSGVFLFDESSERFLDNWHQKTLEIFCDAKWKTHDQGTLIATAWEMGLQRQFLLTKKFNFIADFHNGRLQVRDKAHLTDDAGETLCSPAFMNIENLFGMKGWDIWDWVESRLSSIA